ncbi:MAG: 23S rRNA (uracil(1939)-C(5))-methyltransferase RlmD [Bacteroidetes bacterium]|nr:23S rRNA (uracil(1939)-C(5))-methyltransferase RlmD [Bacteroidota bacterium]
MILENILISGIAAEGKALAMVNGKVLFVPQAIPGDVVDIEITHKKKGYMEGRLLHLRQPSTDRIAPFCPHFGNCGGCKWQSLPYHLQLKYKQQQVYDQLTRIGKLEIPAISPIIGAQKTREYRNKLEFTFSNRSWISRETFESPAGFALTQQCALGFHISGFFDKVLDLNHCYLQPEPSNAIRLSIKSFAQEHDYSFFDLKTQTGFLRTLMIRTATTGQVMVVLAFSYEDIEKRTALLDYLMEQFPSITSLMYVINEKRNDSFEGLEVLPYRGTAFIMEQMESFRFKIGPKSFYQTNSDQAYQLYRVVRDFAGGRGCERIYDLYTGTGTIALFLSPYAKEVIGIEYVAEAIADARENADINKIANSRFYAGDLRKVLNADFILRNGKPDLIVVDPPRAGMHPDVVHTILEAAPLKIIYVSCNPATQARDLQVLSTRYSVQAVQPVDMFPHTHHVENVLLLQKK